MVLEIILVALFILIGAMKAWRQVQGDTPRWFDYWIMYTLYGVHVVFDYVLPWLDK